jgi:hypothetical protein
VKSGWAKRSSGVWPIGLVHRQVVALLEPGLEAELDLPAIVQPQGPELRLELLDDGPIPPLDGAAAFAGIRRAVPELGAEMSAGEGELVGAVGRAVIDVEGLRQAAGEDGLLEAVLQGRDLLGGVPRGVGDELGVVVDDGAEVQGVVARPGRVPEQRGFVVVADPELTRALEGQADVALVAEGAEPAAGGAGVGEVAIEGGPAELALDHLALGFEDVDHRRRGARGDFPPRGDGRVEDLRGQGPEGAAILAPLRQEPFEAVPPVGAPPRPQRARAEPPLAAGGRAVGAGSEIGDAGRALAARQPLDVELADDGVAEEGDLAAAGLWIVDGLAHAAHLPPAGDGAKYSTPGRAGLGEPGDPADRQELGDQPPAERARVSRRLRLCAMQEGQRHEDLRRLEHRPGAGRRARPAAGGHGPGQHGRIRAACLQASRSRQERCRGDQGGEPADPAPDGDPPTAEHGGDRRVRRPGIERVRERGRLGQVGLEATVRVQPRRSQRPAPPALLPRTPHALHGHPLRRPMRPTIEPAA